VQDPENTTKNDTTTTVQDAHPKPSKPANQPPVKELDAKKTSKVKKILASTVLKKSLDDEPEVKPEPISKSEPSIVKDTPRKEIKQKPKNTNPEQAGKAKVDDPSLNEVKTADDDGSTVIYLR
jgi:hypothetical protein